MSRFGTGILSLLLFLSLFCTSSVGNAASTPRSFVKELEEQTRTMLNMKDMARANELFAEHLDMPLFSQRCLIDHWEEFTPAERTRYQNLLEQNIRKKMRERALLAPDDISFRLTPQKISSEDGLIRIDNLLRVKENDVKLGLLLVKQSDQYQVADYDFDGALLSRNYRGQFNYLLRKYGKTGFFEKLEAKVQ